MYTAIPVYEARQVSLLFQRTVIHADTGDRRPGD